jgi:prevent-host-death family protein
MQQVTLEEATARLAELVEAVGQEGTEIVITSGSEPVARLVPPSPPRPRPRFGSARGLIRLAKDFDAPLEEFREYQ